MAQGGVAEATEPWVSEHQNLSPVGTSESNRIFILLSESLVPSVTAVVFPAAPEKFAFPRQTRDRQLTINFHACLS